MKTKSTCHWLWASVTDEIVMGGWRTGEFSFTTVKHMAKLSCVIICKAEN